MLRNHLAPLRADQNVVPRKIVKELESRFTEVVSKVSALVEDTLADRQLHTTTIGGGACQTWLLVSVLPCSRHNAPNFFRQEYPPGYTGYMDHWLRSSLVQRAKAMGHDVFGHVLLYADPSPHEPLSISVGIVPFEPRKYADPFMLMPEEALTTEEKSALGIETQEPGYQPIESMANWSLGLGLCLFAGCLTGLPAIVCGCIAFGRINKNPTLGGKGRSVAGILLGILSTSLSLVYYGFMLYFIAR